MKAHYTIVALLVMTLMVSCAKFEKTPATTEYQDIIFAEAPTIDGGTKELKINIWKGERKEPQPVVLFVHGGAWEGGDNHLDSSKSEQIQTIMALRQYGITIAAPTYRFLTSLSSLHKFMMSRQPYAISRRMPIPMELILSAS